MDNPNENHPELALPDAKRPRFNYEEEEGNSTQESIITSVCNSLKAESLIFRLINFFSLPENKNVETIESVLIPSLLSESTILKGGYIADLTTFKNVNIYQLRFLYKIFEDANQLKINHLTTSSLLMGYISCFTKANKLTIFISEDDTFAGKDIKLSIKELKIISKERSNWNDAIEQLIKSCPLLNKIYIRNGNLSLGTCIKILEKNTTSVCLKNVKIQPQFKNALYSIFRNCKNLKQLKLIATDTYYSNITFHDITREFLGIFITQNTTLEKLSFTLCQYEKQILNNLLNLTELKELKVYYSAQLGSGNLVSLLNVLRHMPQVRIIFVEYYFIPERIFQNRTHYMDMLKSRSIKFKALIDNFCKDATTITCATYDKLFNHSDLN